MRPQYSVRQRAEIYLARIQPTKSDRTTRAQNFYAAIILTKGFLIPPDEAYEILLGQFNTRCKRPILSPEELKKVVEAAYKSEDRRPRGWLFVDLRK